MARMTVRVPSTPDYPPYCALDGACMAPWGLQLRLGTDVVQVEVPADVETITWLSAVLYEAASRMRVAAEELSRQAQEEAAKDE